MDSTVERAGETDADPFQGRAGISATTTRATPTATPAHPTLLGHP
ncbi:MAG: hypothetical protein ACRDRX_27080 [Pseudonocardiaceae bacterium]